MWDATSNEELHVHVSPVQRTIFSVIVPPQTPLASISCASVIQQIHSKLYSTATFELYDSN